MRYSVIYYYSFDVMDDKVFYIYIYNIVEHHTSAIDEISRYRSCDVTDQYSRDTSRIYLIHAVLQTIYIMPRDISSARTVVLRRWNSISPAASYKLYSVA